MDEKNQRKEFRLISRRFREWEIAFSNIETAGQTAHLIDLSSNGMQCQFTEPHSIEPGTLVRGRLITRESPAGMDFSGNVRWTASSTIGIEFNEAFRHFSRIAFEKHL